MTYSQQTINIDETDIGITIQEAQKLQREASFASTILGSGLTELRKADFVNFSYYIHAFLDVASGIERLMKLIFVYDFRANYGKLPDHKVLKKWGHNNGNKM